MFGNRYWVNDTYYKQGGPVFFYDTGEGDAHPEVSVFLAEAYGPSAVMALTRRFGGLAVLFEHRFYGSSNEGSFPFSMDLTTGMAVDGYSAYKYLNTEQALQDTVYFASNFEPRGLDEHWRSWCDDACQKSKNILRYLGFLSTHSGYGISPILILSTSAPLKTCQQLFCALLENPSLPNLDAKASQVDMWTYYAQTERSMTRNCSADFTAVTNYIDSVLTNGTFQQILKLKREIYNATHIPFTLNVTEMSTFENSEIADSLLAPLDGYQNSGFALSTLGFCDVLETIDRRDLSTTDNGGTSPAIAPESGLAAAYNITLAYRSFLFALQKVAEPRPVPQLRQIDEMSWMWQSCSEYGFYARGNPLNRHTIVSRFQSLDYLQEQCNQAFPFLQTAAPNVAGPNKYGGWNMNPSNTMFTNGEFDPWRSVSPASTDTEIGAPGRRTVQDVPPCNVSPRKDELFGIVYRDQVHAPDLLLDTELGAEPFLAGVGLFGMALERWLDCFGK
ncbi:MAG: hypothetical protein Q9190_003179 [Brigantiaea leucoxantha]